MILLILIAILETDKWVITFIIMNNSDEIQKQEILNCIDSLEKNIKDGLENSRSNLDKQSKKYEHYKKINEFCNIGFILIIGIIALLEGIYGSKYDNIINGIIAGSVLVTMFMLYIYYNPAEKATIHKNLKVIYNILYKHENRIIKSLEYLKSGNSQDLIKLRNELLILETEIKLLYAFKDVVDILYL